MGPYTFTGTSTYVLDGETLEDRQCEHRPGDAAAHQGAGRARPCWHAIVENLKDA